MARLEIQITGDNKDFKKILKDTQKDLADFGKLGIDSKPLTAYQAELLKIKKQTLELTRQKEEDRKAQSALNAEIKNQAKAEKYASDAAAKRKTIISDSAKEAKAFNQATIGTNGKVNTAFTAYLLEVKKDFDAGKISAQQYVAELERYSAATLKSIQATSQQSQANKQNGATKKELATDLAIEKIKQQEAAAATKNSARAMINATGSIEQLRAILIKLNAEYDRLSKKQRDSFSGKQLGETIAGLTNQIKGLEAATGRAQRNVGNYGSGLGGLFKSIQGDLISLAASYATFSAISSAAKSIAHNNLEISDSLTDVRRTAKLSSDEVDDLSKELKKLDTRTSLEGLLDIGFIGGRLSVPKDDLVDFIKQVDELSVVLKKEFPGGAEAVAESLGKIVTIYKVTQKEGVSLGTALSKVGSDLLELAHSGPVTLKYLQDFTLGVAGTAASANLSLPVISAYGAVLGESGQIASSAALSITRLVNDLSVKRSQYFAIAQLADSTITIEKFTKLINTDTKAALDAFFKGLKAGNPTQTEFADRLQSVGIKTGKVSNAVKILANNQDKLTEKIKIASKGFEEGSSVAHNFELANGSLAASVDKLQNSLVNLTTNPNSNLAKFFQNIVDGSTYAIKSIEDFQNALDKTQAEQDRQLINSKQTGSGYFKELLLGGTRFGVDDKSAKGYREALAREKGRRTSSLNGRIQDQGFAIADQQSAGLNDTGIKDLLNKTNGALTQRRIAIDRLNNAFKFIRDPKNSGKGLEEVSKNINKLRADAARQNAIVDRLRSKLTTDNSVLGDGSLADQDNERTPDVIKAEIKALQAANGKLKVGSKELAAGVARLKALKQELRDALGIETKGASTKNPNAPNVLPLLDGADNSGLDGVDKQISEAQQKYSAYYGKLDEYNKKKNANIAKSDQLRDQAKIAEGKEVSNIIAAENQRVADAIAGINEKAGIVREASRLKDLQENDAYYNEQIRQNVGQSQILNALEAARLQERSNINKKYDDEILQKAKDLQDKIAEVQDKAFTENIKGNEKGRAKVREQLNDRLKDIQSFFDKLRELYKNDPIALIGINAAQLGVTQNVKANASTAANPVVNQQKEAIRGVVESFGRDLSNTLQNLGNEADATFSGIFSTLTDGLIKSLNDVTFTQFSKKLSDALLNGGGLKLNANEATALGLGVGGSILSGATKKTSTLGQGLGSALSGAGAGVAIGTALGPGGALIGGLIGGGLGLLSGIFGAGKAKKEEQAQKRALEEQKKQTALLERANALAYAAQIVGRQTVNGVVTGVDINEFGQVITKISGSDLLVIHDRSVKNRNRGK